LGHIKTAPISCQVNLTLLESSFYRVNENTAHWNNANKGYMHLFSQSFSFLIYLFATVHFYNQSKEKGIKATGIGIE
jgi:Na+/H+ antiporter NhaC